MPTIFQFEVVPSLPPQLEPLREIAYNIWWTWNHDAIRLFRRIDRDLWEEVYHNPLLLMGRVSQSRLEELTRDEGFMSSLGHVYSHMKAYLERTTWFTKKYGNTPVTIAYFSMEYGLTECLPIYSGGLGLLSGDTTKSASDLGLPFVCVGLAYQQGYFSQYLNADGYQQERYPINDFFNLPMRPVFDAEGKVLKVPIWFPHRTVMVQIWKVAIGRIPLFLLDTNCPENDPADRKITDALYGGDQEIRIQQEVVLGIGGIRALQAMNITADVCHMNEGHSAFLTLERIRQLREKTDLSFREAREAIGSANAFTSHTPVPAGFDIFGTGLMEKYLRDYPGRLNLSLEEFMALGRRNPKNTDEGFNMALLAGRHASYINGVSKLHAVVTREMVKDQWEGLPKHEIPIRAITNGIHLRSWLSRDMIELFDTYLGTQWHEDPENTEIWKRLANIPDEELWNVHIRRRERLVGLARQRLFRQLQKRGASRPELEDAREVLNPHTLTIGFARRFATYKRATLLLRNPERLRQLMMAQDRSIQIIYAGKAHPKDMHGKELIKQIVHFAREANIRRRIVFLEDYDINMARYLVQGVDVWLNTPRRPMEASGTSGMKAAVNGALNLSVLDGWWDEAYNPNVGWAIGHGEDYDAFSTQDHIEANALYNLLENEIVPLYYTRASDKLPRGWIKMMKQSMIELIPQFNTHRMVQEYTDYFYMNAVKRSQDLAKDNHSRARALAAWKSRLFKNWDGVKVHQVRFEKNRTFQVGEKLSVEVDVELGTLKPTDVVVQLYSGPLNEKGEIVEGRTDRMQNGTRLENGHYRYRQEMSCGMSGRHGFSARVLPSHEDLVTNFDLSLITWV